MCSAQSSHSSCTAMPCTYCYPLPLTTRTADSGDVYRQRQRSCGCYRSAFLCSAVQRIWLWSRGPRGSTSVERRLLILISRVGLFGIQRSEANTGTFGISVDTALFLVLSCILGTTLLQPRVAAGTREESRKNLGESPCESPEWNIFGWGFHFKCNTLLPRPRKMQSLHRALSARNWIWDVTVFPSWLLCHVDGAHPIPLAARVRDREFHSITLAIRSRGLRASGSAGVGAGS